MILVDGLHHMLGNFVHVEKSNANSPACHPAGFFHCLGHSFEGKMFKQVVDKKKVKRLVYRINLENIPQVKPDTGKQGPRILDVFLAEIESAVVNKPADSERLQKTVIVRGTARRFND